MSRHKSPIHWVLSIGIVAHVFMNIIFSLFLLNIASVNYPGGVAIARLHRLEPEGPVSVHICNLAAQTGVSRFTQLYPNWKYDKTEYLDDGSLELYNFTHLIVEAKSKYSPVLKMYSRSHDILDSIEGFSHISINYNMFPPVKIKTKQFLYILKLKSNFVLPSTPRDMNFELLDEAFEESPVLESALLQKDEDEEELYEDKVEDTSDEPVPLPAEAPVIIDSEENILETENQSIENETDDSTNVEKDVHIEDYKPLTVVDDNEEEVLPKQIEDVKKDISEDVSDESEDKEFTEINIVKENVEELIEQQKETIVDNKTDAPPAKKVKSNIKKIIEAFKENESVVDIGKDELEASKIKKTTNISKKKLPIIKPIIKKPVVNTLKKDEIINETPDLKPDEKVEEVDKPLKPVEDDQEKTVVEEPQLPNNQELLHLQLQQLQMLLQQQQLQLELLLQQQKSQKPVQQKAKKDLPKEPEIVDDSAKKEPVIEPVDPVKLEEYEERKKRTKLRIKNIIQNLRAAAAPVDPEIGEQNLTTKPVTGDAHGVDDDDETETYFKTEFEDEDYEL